MKFIDWIFDHFVLVFIIGAILSAGITLWVYDGDARCLFAECRIVKK